MLKKIFAVLATLATVSAMAAVEVNKATEADLDSLKGVGPATSKQILAERKKSEFKDWEDLMHRVKGIGEAKAGKLSAEGLTVNGHSFKDMSPAAVVPGKATKASGADKPHKASKHKEGAASSGSAAKP